MGDCCPGDAPNVEWIYASCWDITASHALSDPIYHYSSVLHFTRMTCIDSHTQRVSTYCVCPSLYAHIRYSYASGSVSMVMIACLCWFQCCVWCSPTLRPYIYARILLCYGCSLHATSRIHAAVHYTSTHMYIY